MLHAFGDFLIRHGRSYSWPKTKAVGEVGEVPTDLQKIHGFEGGKLMSYDFSTPGWLEKK